MAREPHPDDQRRMAGSPVAVSRDALICRHADSASLLSTRTWQYFSLNATATRLWDGLASGRDLDELAQATARDEDVPAEVVRDDLHALVATLTRLGFLTTHDSPAPASRRWPMPPTAETARTVPTLAQSVAALLGAGLRLRTTTLDPASWLSPTHGRDTGRRLAARERHLITRQVRRAAAWLPARTFCLQQSLALITLLRRSGVDARLRLGARPFPFVAHAWVEANDVPVNEHDEQVAMYARFLPAIAA